MTIVNNFPFVLPNLVTLTVSMPYYNNVTQKVAYQALNDTFWDDTVGHTDYEAVLLKWAWLNQCNPSWKDPIIALNLPIPSVQGEGVINCPGCIGVQVKITDGADLTDRWWGSSLIGRFGVIFPTNAPMPNPTLAMPPYYINSPNSSIEFDTNVNPPNWIYFNIPAGMTATITCAQVANRVDAPGAQSKAPPIYYEVPAGYSTLTPFTANNPAPTTLQAVYGP